MNGGTVGPILSPPGAPPGRTHPNPRRRLTPPALDGGKGEAAALGQRGRLKAEPEPSKIAVGAGPRGSRPPEPHRGHKLGIIHTRPVIHYRDERGQVRLQIELRTNLARMSHTQQRAGRSELCRGW